MAEDKKGSAPASLEEHFYLSLTEVTYSFGVSEETIRELIDEGIVSVEQESGDWRFDDESIRSIRTVLQLHRDLGVNFAGGALALDLLKEIDRLHRLLNKS